MCNSSTKQDTSTSSNQTQQATMSPEERQWYANRNAIDAASLQDTITMNKNAASLINTLLTGGQLPGNLSKLSSGLSQEWQNNAAMNAVNQANASLNQTGIADSGAAQVARARAAGDIYSSAEQFNISTLQQLLNQAIGGQASVVGTTQNNANALGSTLAGLRTISSTGTGTSSMTTTSNPFLNSLYTSAGSSLGNATFGNSRGWFGR